MPDLGVLGWIFVGLIAGALSGLVVGGRTARGCLPNIVVGVIGGLLGGFLARELFDVDQTTSFLGALVVAFLGAVVIRFVLESVGPGRRVR
ncbi:MAG: GlsB/YeaQ/YmgE family stress response membrane protein [Chloroflexi bacterium]|nr:GlsB/YeaQ/YmgE family stress response membrane protein [Chloroflexota bacterium]